MGGIAANFGTNLLLDRNSSYIVIEADEFDRSFLHLSPEIAVITAMDEDHLDIYENKANLLEAFEAFAGQVNPQGGRLFLKKGLQLKQTQVTGYYGVEVKADCYADGLRIEQGRYVFDYHGRGVDIEGLILGIPGRLNVENATAAITLALEAGVQPEEIRRALPDFKGVARRFNIQVYTERTIYIDDYAHHPREIEATLRSVREMWARSAGDGGFSASFIYPDPGFSGGFRPEPEFGRPGGFTGDLSGQGTTYSGNYCGSDPEKAYCSGEYCDKRGTVTTDYT